MYSTDNVFLNNSGLILTVCFDLAKSIYVNTKKNFIFYTEKSPMSTCSWDKMISE